MRINKYVATYSKLSRRGADDAIRAGRITINDRPASLGDAVLTSDTVRLDGEIISQISTNKSTVVLLHKPVGYVCSRDGQGSPTVYDLLPPDFISFNIAGRLDKDSSGLVVLTNDGELLHELTHPSKLKEKIYEITTNKPLDKTAMTQLHAGVDIGDNRRSSFKSIDSLPNGYRVVLEEGRNRQIRRTIEALGYRVTALKRTYLGSYHLGTLSEKDYQILDAA